jgi:uncharacterized coiled-coil protein SlyX
MKEAKPRKKPGPKPAGKADRSYPKTVTIYEADKDHPAWQMAPTKHIIRAGLNTVAGRSEQVDRIRELESKVVLQERQIQRLINRVQGLYTILEDFLGVKEINERLEKLEEVKK